MAVCISWVLPSISEYDTLDINALMTLYSEFDFVCIEVCMTFFYSKELITYSEFCSIFYESQILSDIQQILCLYTLFKILYNDILLWILMTSVIFVHIIIAFCIHWWHNSNGLHGEFLKRIMWDEMDTRSLLIEKWWKCYDK